MKQNVETIMVGMAPSASDRVNQLYVWVSIYPDGSESIMAADFVLPDVGVTRHMPLMGAKRTTAERVEPLAKRMQAQSELHGIPIKIELRAFTRVP